MDKIKDKKAGVTSIARKINLDNMARMFFAYVGMDIIVFVLLAAIFVVGMDLQMAGTFSFSYIRKISFQTDLWSAVCTVMDSKDTVSGASWCMAQPVPLWRDCPSCISGT